MNLTRYIDREIKHLKEKVNLIFSKNSQALKIAKKALSKKLRSMNKIREQLDRQILTFVSIEKYDGEMKAVNQKVDNITKILYVGIGIWLLLQVIIIWVLTIYFKSGT